MVFFSFEIAGNWSKNIYLSSTYQMI